MTNQPPKSVRDRIDKQAAEDYEFERPWRDMVGAIRAVQSMLIKAEAMALIARCMAAKPTDNNDEQPSC